MAANTSAVAAKRPAVRASNETLSSQAMVSASTRASMVSIMVYMAGWRSMWSSVSTIHWRSSWGGEGGMERRGGGRMGVRRERVQGSLGVAWASRIEDVRK